MTVGYDICIAMQYRIHSILESTNSLYCCILALCRAVVKHKNDSLDVDCPRHQPKDSKTVPSPPIPAEYTLSPFQLTRLRVGRGNRNRFKPGT